MAIFFYISMTVFWAIIADLVICNRDYMVDKALNI